MRSTRVYIAGPMSSADPIRFLENLRRGMRLSTECLLSGYAVFSPFIDYSLFFQLRDGEKISVDAIQKNSMAWLEASDAVLLCDCWQESRGTQAELFRARELNIPVFTSLDYLKAWRSA